MTLEVVHRHEKLAPEFGVEFMAPISGACVRGSRRSAMLRKLDGVHKAKLYNRAVYEAQHQAEIKDRHSRSAHTSDVERTPDRSYIIIAPRPALLRWPANNKLPLSAVRHVGRSTRSLRCYTSGEKDDQRHGARRTTQTLSCSAD